MLVERPAKAVSKVHAGEIGQRELCGGFLPQVGAVIRGVGKTRRAKVTT